MFYMVNDSSSATFQLGFIEKEDVAVTLLEGNSVKGVLHKKELLCTTQEEAWMKLCEVVMRFRSSGYRCAPLPSIANFIPPTDPYQGVFPVELTGVHVTFGELSAEQFAAGLDRLGAAAKALEGDKTGITVTATDASVEILSSGVRTRLSKLSLAEWETMPNRARELFEDRKFIDSQTLLPTGEGSWWFPTQSGVLDIYLRAFLGGLADAGGSFTCKGDEWWSFTPKKPFEIAAVRQMPWYSKMPNLYQTIVNAGLLGAASTPRVVAPARTGISFFL